jgi:hypothetical protein
LRQEKWELRLICDGDIYRSVQQTKGAFPMNIKEITNQTIFTTDWAKGDRRSVKAYLAGNGDGRVLWWNINRLTHQLFRPTASLAKIMFCFHSRHHVMTLLSLKYQADVQEVAKVIQSKGVMAGIRRGVSSSKENTLF